MAREPSLEGRARERFLALPHCQNCSCENLFQEVPCQLKLTPELSRAVLWPRRWHSLRRHAEATKRSRLERIVRPHAYAPWLAAIVWSQRLSSTKSELQRSAAFPASTR